MACYPAPPHHWLSPTFLQEARAEKKAMSRRHCTLHLRRPHLDLDLDLDLHPTRPRR